MKQMFKNTLLITLIGSVMFLFSCNEDKDPVAEAPVASFSVSVDGATATFTNNSTGEDNTYAWDFGDGANSTSSDATVTKTYTEAGTYSVTLTATNDGGENSTSSEVVISASAVDSEAPVIILAEGTSVIDVNLGDTYTDTGVTATDNVDVDLTDEIVVGGDVVNTEVSGTYVITYDVTDAAGNAATQVTRTVRVRYPDGLLTNGDFEEGTTGWSGNALDVRTEGTNSYTFADVATAGNSFDVNLSQGLELEQGKTYLLSFDASTSTGTSRGIIAGIGLSVVPFTSATELVTLTDQSQTFELELSAAAFGGANSRVLFDMGAEVGVVVIDNVSLVETEPTAPPAPTDAPTAPPARDAADVISIYGEAYGTAIGLNNVDWDEGSNSAEETYADNKVLKLSFNTFLGTDLGSEVDASGMTHVHMDLWIADDFNAGQVFLPKWSNHNGAEETDAFEYTYAVGGDDSKKWLSIDVALTDWNNVKGSGSDARANLKQLIFGVSGTLDVVYLDNVYFYNDGSGTGGGGGGGSATAPTDAPSTPPARDAADVISIYGDAYGTAIGLNNVTWDEGSEATEETHADNNVLKLSFQTFLGTDLGSEVDASGMTHVHMDFWIADDFNAGQVFLPKWSNHNGGGETDAFEYTFAVGGDDSKKWLSIDVPIADWNNVAGGGPDARANLKQLVIGVSGTLDVVYMDNVYFYKN